MDAFVPDEADAVADGVFEGLHNHIRRVGQGWGFGFKDEGYAVPLGDNVEDGGDIGKVLRRGERNAAAFEFFCDACFGIRGAPVIHQDSFSGEVLKTDAALYPGQWMGGGEKSVEGAAGQIEISNVFRQPFRLYDKAGINVILVILKVFQQLRIAPVVNAQCDVRMGGGKFIQNRGIERGAGYRGYCDAQFVLAVSPVFDLFGNRIEVAEDGFSPPKKLLTGRLSPDDWDNVSLAVAALSRTRILIDDNPALTVADMNAKCRRVEDLGLVVIDYLQLMQASGSGTKYAGENRQQVVADISRSLKIMAKELRVPVLCLSQLSRANESRQNKRPMLSYLRESGAIEQDADVVMFLYREDYYNADTDKRNQAECIIAKNRRGETTTVPLTWLPEFTSFSSAEHNHDDDDDL